MSHMQLKVKKKIIVIVLEAEWKMTTTDGGGDAAHYATVHSTKREINLEALSS